MTDVVNTSTKVGFNAYHRNYYNNKAEYKAKRKQQFAAYYQANKTRLNERKKELRLQKRQQQQQQRLASTQQ
jgi:hypothetical protein